MTHPDPPQAAINAALQAAVDNDLTRISSSSVRVLLAAAGPHIRAVGLELTETEQWAVREARDMLARWDRDRGTPDCYGTERTLADHLRTVLSLVPKESADA